MECRSKLRKVEHTQRGWAQPPPPNAQHVPGQAAWARCRGPAREHCHPMAQPARRGPPATQPASQSPPPRRAKQPGGARGHAQHHRRPPSPPHDWSPGARVTACHRPAAAGTPPPPPASKSPPAESLRLESCPRSLGRQPLPRPVSLGQPRLPRPASPAVIGRPRWPDTAPVCGPRSHWRQRPPAAAGTGQLGHRRWRRRP
mmetsp:Transcript_31797/g.102743  ORF Transcript_31797/g.102743 Transcript_31797/m.102743 type:complete len:201 (-) Transcript_31797:325-927(-)